MRLSYKQEWPGDEATLDCNSGGWRFAPYLMLWQQSLIQPYSAQGMFRYLRSGAYQQRLAFHTPAVWVWCPETLSHSVIRMRLLTIKLSSSLQVLYSPSISTPSSMAISSSSVWSHSSHQTSASRSEPPLSCSPCAILRYRCCLHALYLETKLLHSTPKNIT